MFSLRLRAFMHPRWSRPDPGPVWYKGCSGRERGEVAPSPNRGKIDPSCKRPPPRCAAFSLLDGVMIMPYAERVMNENLSVVTLLVVVGLVLRNLVGVLVRPVRVAAERRR